METLTLPLHVCQVQQPRATINRIHILIHSIAILALLYYRASVLFVGVEEGVPIFLWAMIFASELMLSFLWLLNQVCRWRPVSRTVFPERLPGDEKLPAIDVLICTADPKKEPTVEVMNTVLSAMSLDYPPEKLSVYLSDDGGSPITLYGIREASTFARFWLPFCKEYGILTRCPQAYFSESDGEDRHQWSTEFMEKRETVKLKYEVFKERVEKKARESAGNGIGDMESISSAKDRPPLIEVIHDNAMEEVNSNWTKMPLLVYVSREKRPSYPHHFKAGALNVLLRVSGIISNSPYILVLDCDMYCNDPTSARQAMCFHLDPKISHSLAFVQFPQNFHNISKNDIYNALLRIAFKVWWHGLDGLKGPLLSGTGFYLKREALYRNAPLDDIDLIHCKKRFGPSNELTSSLRRRNSKRSAIDNGDASNALLQEARFLASCTYEKNTHWGDQIGFLYHSVVEDYFTGFLLHCKGWTSVYCCPSRPPFLGSVTTNLNDTLIQGTRWYSGLLEVSFSRFCPIFYGPLRMSILQSMFYAYMAFLPLNSLPFLCLATIPQLCLWNGIPLYPKVSNPWFYVFSFVHVSSHFQHLAEVLSIGGSFRLWWNQERILLINTVTSYLVGSLDVIMKLIGIKEVKFVPTNKVVDEEQVERYKMGKFDFQVATMFLFPLTTLTLLNLASFVGGLRRVIVERSYDAMFGQLFLSFYILSMSYPIIEGMIMRKDNGRVPTKVTLVSMTFFMILLSFAVFYYD